MSYKWLDDAFEAFQQESGDVGGESLMQMTLAFAYYAEEKGENLADLWRTAKVRKQMFDAAKELLWEGFTPCQVTLILHAGIDSPCKRPSVCEDLGCDSSPEPIRPSKRMPQDPSLWSADQA